ncbi:MAG: hypothetical protein MUP17_09370, partial [candidate division Zixibacteria bacterium]|nr:hypothetical protein [candidate division Zixibacteria bacterium]
MCKYFSCVITKDLKVHWSKKTVNHEELLTEIKIEDVKLNERDFVRIEITPKDQDQITRNPDD